MCICTHCDKPTSKAIAFAMYLQVMWLILLFFFNNVQLAYAGKCIHASHMPITYTNLVSCLLTHSKFNILCFSGVAEQSALVC